VTFARLGVDGDATATYYSNKLNLITVGKITTEMVISLIIMPYGFQILTDIPFRA